MKARDAISYNIPTGKELPRRCVSSETHLLEVLPLLLDAPERRLTVREGKETLGIVDEQSLLEGLGRLLPARDDSSIIVMECRPEDFSASVIARAVEDADAHLVDMMSSPTADGKISVTLRIRLTDPSAAIRSLERYGYDVVDTGGRAMANEAVAEERLNALQVYLNV
ncbi:MAG: hypothetical protein J6C81_05310 [Muribaculaceae bacterium]|nr:hypothetical protein [Muribaculaceae bacterium]